MLSTNWIDDLVSSLPHVLNTSEACAALRVSNRTLHRLLSSGRLGAYRAVHAGSSPHRIPRESIGEYLRATSGARVERVKRSRGAR
jgi:excisionase family DNA binding protein